MKRSDLEQRLNEWLDNATSITGKTILDFVEAEGMLPPENPSDSGSYYIHKLHSWELEDTSKDSK